MIVSSILNKPVPFDTTINGYTYAAPRELERVSMLVLLTVFLLTATAAVLSFARTLRRSFRSPTFDRDKDAGR